LARICYGFDIAATKNVTRDDSVLCKSIPVLKATPDDLLEAALRR
jgi:hypothetical protein